MWDLAAGEQADNCSFVAKSAAVPSVGVQSYDVFITDPRATYPASLQTKASRRWQTSSLQRPQQRRIVGRLDERCWVGNHAAPQAG